MNRVCICALAHGLSVLFYVLQTLVCSSHTMYVRRVAAICCGDVFCGGSFCPEAQCGNSPPCNQRRLLHLHMLTQGLKARTNTMVEEVKLRGAKGAAGKKKATGKGRGGGGGGGGGGGEGADAVVMDGEDAAPIAEEGAAQQEGSKVGLLSC